MTAAAVTLVGDPDGRRARLLQDSLSRNAFPAPRLISWQHVLTVGAPTFETDEIVWLDSPGDSPVIDALLRGDGDQTRIADGQTWYRNLCAAARTLRGGRHLTDADELAILFDKRRCHAHLADHQVPVPRAIHPMTELTDWAAVRDATESAGMSRYFVKPAHGSSAAGVVAVETASGGRVQARSSAEFDRGELHNSLRVRKHIGEHQVGKLIDALAPERLHVEAWIPKPSLDGRSADLRVLVVAGTATHAVLRLGSSPMTNLNLGGRRGDLATAVDRFERSGFGWEHVLDTAEAAADCFPGTLCVGVDLLPTSDWRSVLVGEVNAFGDLLPNLMGLPGRADGLDTYDAQIVAMTDWADDAAA